MRHQETQNLKRSWPVYMFLCMLILILIVFWQHHPLKTEPLDRSIKRNLLGANPKRFKTIDDVINDRTSWQPILADRQGKPTGDFSFSAADAAAGSLKDFSGRQTVVLICASWYPPCKMQLAQLQEALSLIQIPASVIALTAEKQPSGFETDEYPDILFATVTPLPEPFCLPDTVPALFFLDADGRLKLAAEGLLPANHILALLELSR
jgi:thiol-disulfide isomerase/thioredoxin